MEFKQEPGFPVGLGADGHFDAASAFQSLGTPFEQDPLVDDDLLFAASQSAAWYGRLRNERERVLRVLKELSYRWQPVTDYLRSFQPWEVAKATAGRHLGMIGLLGILVDWPDSTFLHNLLTGFPSVGFSPHVASYTSQPATWIPLDEIWDSSFVDAARFLTRLRPGPLDTEIVKAGDKDESLGFCSEPFSWEHLLSLDRPFDSSVGFASNKGKSAVSLTMPMMVGSRPSAVMLTSWISALLSNQASMFGCWPQLFGNSMLPGMPDLIHLKLVEKICLTPIGMFLWFLKTLGRPLLHIGILLELHLFSSLLWTTVWPPQCGLQFQPFSTDASVFLSSTGFLYGIDVLRRLDSSGSSKQQRFQPTVLHQPCIPTWISIF